LQALQISGENKKPVCFVHAFEGKLNFGLCCVKAISSTLDANSNLWQSVGRYI